MNTDHAARVLDNLTPLLTRVLPVPTQRHVTQGELDMETVRVVPGTTKILALVKDTGTAWR